MSDLARLWAASGEDVTVLTGMPNHPTGVIPSKYRRRLRLVEIVEGYRVVRVWLYATPTDSFARRTLGHLSFTLTSVVLGCTGKADLVVVSSPSFFSIFSGWLLARIKRARFIVEVRDLWPAILVELGTLKSRPLIRLLELMELAAYRSADEVVVVTNGFRDNLIRRGISGKRVHVVYNGVDMERFGSSFNERDTARARLGATGESVLVLYIGAHGISQGLTAVAEAAALLSNEQVHFAFVGEGSAKRQLEQRVEELGSKNISLCHGVPHAEVPALVAAADICLVPLRDIPLFSTFIPSKMFDYFAAGKAVIGSVAGEPAQILAQAGAKIVPPGEVRTLASAVQELSRDPQLRVTMGSQARAYVAANFDRRALAEQYRMILLTAASGRR